MDVSYLTAAVSIGAKKDEIDTFITKLDKVLTRVKSETNKNDETS